MSIAYCNLLEHDEHGAGRYNNNIIIYRFHNIVYAGDVRYRNTIIILLYNTSIRNSYYNMLFVVGTIRKICHRELHIILRSSKSL